MSIVYRSAASDPNSKPGVIRVMVVDDAVVVRGLLARWIDAEPGLQVVASLRSGREAIEQLDRANPDVVILDIDMPDTDGITALPLLLEKRRDLVVIMASTLTRRNAEISLRALALGAADYIPKPESTREVTTSTAFHRELVEKIKALGARRKERAATARTIPLPRRQTRPPQHREQVETLAPATGADAKAVSSRAPAGLRLRPFSPTPPRVLLIGSSTGGPQALNVVLGQLQAVIDHAPVLIVQHMPPTFTTILAEHLERASGRPAREGIDGEAIRAGQIYIAPGGLHMRVVRRDGSPVIRIDDDPPLNFCKPAVDPLFSSAAAVWGDKCLAVVLTGMGYDGVRGAGELVDAGGIVIAQDEESSVVWGMPGSVAQAGLCSAVLPLADIAPTLIKLFSGVRQ